ncbi:hypothetical protein [Nocardia brasiliensis]|uniref:hypothetical protein n=1 Tax=Nocardia brasiliensis TaxID=37326 RepID=UPI0024562EEE|nr:hypothetical protein [Nocardia brasiliensis]
MRSALEFSSRPCRITRRGAWGHARNRVFDMTSDKQRKRAARQHASTQGTRYTRAKRELAMGTARPGAEDIGGGADCAVVEQLAEDVARRVMALSHIPTQPVAHRDDHLGQCLNREIYGAAVELAHHSAVYVSSYARSGVVDEMSLYHARQAVGQLTRAQASSRDALTDMVSEVLQCAVKLPETTESVMAISCELAQSTRMARNEWFCEVTGLAQGCSAGARDLRLAVRDGQSGRVVEMAPGCVDHVTEEIVTWTSVPGIEIEVLGGDPAVIELVWRRAEQLRETEHWLLGPRWWERERALTPESPFTALFT